MFLESFQQFLRRFVGGVLGDELAGEPRAVGTRETNFAKRKGAARTSGQRVSPRAGEEGGRELLHLPARLGQPLLKLVGQRKQSLHSPHDFLLLGEWWKCDRKLGHKPKLKVRDCSILY